MCRAKAEGGHQHFASASESDASAIRSGSIPTADQPVVAGSLQKRRGVGAEEAGVASKHLTFREERWVRGLSTLFPAGLPELGRAIERW